MQKHTEQKEFSFVPIPGEALDMWWDKLCVLLEESPETWANYYNLHNIYQQIEVGELQLFVILKDFSMEFAMLTRVNRYPKVTTVNCIWCSGREIDRFLPMALESIDRFAYSVGANMIKLQGRFGWKRLLAPYGYGLEMVQLKRTLPGCQPKAI